MRLALTIAFLCAFASPAHACVKLPTPSGTRVPISAAGNDVKRTAVRVCGHVLARATMRGVNAKERDGVRIGAASAAGNRVAWIEERVHARDRRSIVTLAAVGKRVRVLRRFTVQRVRTIFDADVGVILTREGDLAWASSTYGDYPGVIAVKQPGRKVRRLWRDYSSGLALEDGRTLRWSQGFGDLYYFDLHSKPCPSRSRFTEFARTDRVLLTRAVYPLRSPDENHTVLRACDLATGRDHVATQSYSEMDYESTLSFVGFDRTWAVFTTSVNDFHGGTSSVTAFDAVTGRRATYNSEYSGGVEYPPPTAAAGYAVTDAGVLAWVAGTTLYALVKGKVVTLDQGAPIAGLHAEGVAVVWTHDGAPRSVTPA